MLFNLAPFLYRAHVDRLKEIKTNWTSINFDGHYLFPMDDDRFDVYPLAGINIAIVSVKNDLLNLDASETKVGLNLDDGGQYEINDLLTDFAEIKYVISDFDQLVIGGGILVTIRDY